MTRGREVASPISMSSRAKDFAPFGDQVFFPEMITHTSLPQGATNPGHAREPRRWKKLENEIQSQVREVKD